MRLIGKKLQQLLCINVKRQQQNACVNKGKNWNRCYYNEYCCLSFGGEPGQVMWCCNPQYKFLRKHHYYSFVAFSEGDFTIANILIGWNTFFVHSVFNFFPGKFSTFSLRDEFVLLNVKTIVFFSTSRITPSLFALYNVLIFELYKQSKFKSGFHWWKRTRK